MAGFIAGNYYICYLRLPNDLPAAPPVDNTTNEQPAHIVDNRANDLPAHIRANEPPAPPIEDNRANEPLAPPVEGPIENIRQDIVEDIAIVHSGDNSSLPEHGVILPNNSEYSAAYNTQVAGVLNPKAAPFDPNVQPVEKGVIDSLFSASTATEGKLCTNEEGALLINKCDIAGGGCAICSK